MKAILPHSVLAMDKIPELKIPEDTRGQISSAETCELLRSWLQPSKVQSVLKGRQDPAAGPRTIVTKV